MSLLAAIVTFQKTTTAAPVQQQITGVGFQPKALILHSVGATALNTAQTQYRLTWGLSAGPGASVCVSHAYLHNVNPSQVAGAWYSHPLAFVNPNNTLAALAALVSLDADGFTLNWTTNDANAYYISCIALGGDSITAAAIDQFVTNNSGSYTRAGFDLAPTALIAIGSQWSGGLADGTATQRSAAFGVAGHRGAAATISAGAGHNAAGNTLTSLGPANVALHPAYTTTSATRSLYPPRFTADGYTIREYAASSQQIAMGALLLAGPVVHITYLPKPTLTPDTLSLAPHPTGAPLIIAAHAPLYPAPTPANQNRITFGAATATDSFATRVGGYWTGAMQSTMMHRDDCLLTDADPSTGTEATRATADDIDSAPLLTFNPNSADGTTIMLATLTDATDALAPDRSIVFPMWDAATGKTPTAGLTITAERSTDGAAFTACDNAVDEIGDGYYRLILTANDRAGTAILFKFTTTGALTQSVQLLSRP